VLGNFQTPSGNSVGHALVVGGINAAGTVLTVYDPADGKSHLVDYRAFIEANPQATHYIVQR
jgi:hypothetical protein